MSACITCFHKLVFFSKEFPFKYAIHSVFTKFEGKYFAAQSTEPLPFFVAKKVATNYCSISDLKICDEYTEVDKRT